MISVKEEHFSLNRLLLLAVGLWPYQRSIFVELQVIFFYCILIAFIIVQFAVFLTSEYTIDVIIKILSGGFAFMQYTIQYTTFHINIQLIKGLFEQLQHMCNKLHDINEIAIIKRYGNYGRQYTIVFTMLAICYLIVFILLAIWRCFLEVASLNETRTHHLLFMTEYFIDQQRYFYLIMLHSVIALFMAVIIMLGTGTTLTTYLLYSCGMFSIVSYRIKQAMKLDLLQNINLKNEHLILEGIVHAIDIHRKAMKFSDFLSLSFIISYMILMVISVITLSLALIQVSQALASENILEELLVPVTILLWTYMYMFMANYSVQNISEHNDDIFVTVYNVQWYATPLHVQKIILFLLQRGTKPFYLDIGGIFIPSFQGLTSLTSAIISYFTIIYSVSTS